MHASKQWADGATLAFPPLQHSTDGRIAAVESGKPPRALHNLRHVGAGDGAVGFLIQAWGRQVSRLELGQGWWEFCLWLVVELHLALRKQGRESRSREANLLKSCMDVSMDLNTR